MRHTKNRKKKKKNISKTMLHIAEVEMVNISKKAWEIKNPDGYRGYSIGL
ncbi:hypothetical protein RG47T_4907 [Mucilaginibacter polytrichastri]|uniref:Uncharacterized protein n=1 Tax=Mucilaginibacter polytrichastri TaxID=1302689 RepID=A0A1Q6A5Y7_9SPHI|nr:hypothetical protein RG47T_4907 [Mucilaginibacter polytrichastri]